MSTTIYVMTHKPAVIPDDPVYCALHVGKAGKQDIGYLGDDTGDNISGKNDRYGELTGLYWVWKNAPENDVVGMCHYRRFFLNDDGKVLTGHEYEERLETHDVIVSKEMDAGVPYIEYYNEAHDARQQELVREAIGRLYPEYLETYDRAMAEPFYHYGNLMVTRRERLDQYAEWLFDILGYVEERLDVSGYDAYHGRVYGFLSEQLLRVWIVQNGLRVFAAPIGITGEKAETKELKLAMGQLVKMGQFKEARQMFGEILRLRPDVVLELSDLKGELPVIECVLYVLDLEAENGVDGMYAYAKDLGVLIEHYRKLSALVLEGAEDSPEGRAYIKKTSTSKIALEVVRRNPR